MRTWRGIVLVATAWGMDACAAATRMAPDGTPFAFEDWSTPTTLVAKSSAGDVSLVRRTCQVTRQHPQQPTAFTLDLISHPGVDELWIGPMAERYVVAGSKTWGISRLTHCLRIRESESAGGATDGQRLVVDKFLEMFPTDPYSESRPDPHLKTIDLCRVFGGHAFYQGNVYLPPIEITDVAADEVGVTVILRSNRRASEVPEHGRSGGRYGSPGTGTGQETGRTFCITLGSDLEVLSASMDGQRVPVVRNALERAGALQEWSGPVSTIVPSAQGELPALLCSRDYVWADSPRELESNTTGSLLPPVPPRPRHRVAGAKALVLQPTGDVWIGPSDCKVAAVGERILGVTVRDDDLLLFTGPRTRIPLSQGTSQAFEAELVKFDGAFEANRCAWSPDATKNLVELFHGDVRFASAFEFGLRAVAASEDGMALTLSSGTPTMYPEIVIGPNLDIVSVRVLTPTELRSR